MLTNVIAGTMAATFAFIERHFGGRYAILKIALVAIGIVWLFAPPMYEYAVETYRDGAPLILQQQHPFTPNHMPATDHWAKVQFRLVPPLIGHVFDFRATGYFILQFLGFAALFGTMTALLYRATENFVLTALGMFALATTTIGAIINVDSHGFFDSVAIAFYLLAMLSRRSHVVFLCLFLAFFTDERAIIASPMVLLYHLSHAGTETRLTLRSLLRPTPACIAVVGAALLYFACRTWLTYHFGLFTPIDPSELHYIIGNINEWGIGIWSPFEGLWIIVIGSLIILAVRRDFLFLALMAGSIAVMITTSLMALDISRSLSYLAGTLPLAAAIFARNESKSRSFFFAAMAISAVSPTYMVTGSALPYAGGYRNVSQLLPLPIAAWHLFR